MQKTCRSIFLQFTIGNSYSLGEIMFPPQASNLDIEALSGILGSISIACWVVVFSPQIIENFRRQSADGLSLLFIVVWLAGDVFNILGAVLQGVLPTMIILAVYYTLADIVLLGQCLYYRGIWFSGQKILKENIQNGELEEGDVEEPTERTALLNQENGNRHAHTNGSNTQQPHRTVQVDITHLSPATPFIDVVPPSENETSQGASRPSTSSLQAALLNTFAIILVCAAGVLGWYVSSRVSNKPANDDNDPSPEPLTFDLLGQIFGYFCAVLYLGSRIPQLLLNYQRKSTEGVSLLFFLFACIGNLTYVLSIFAYSPVCRSEVCEPGEVGAIYGRYILVNLSWLIGSLGTLLLDMAIFVQFFLYQKDDDGY
ncbi:PQ loop repeat protein [Talaromyces stipitatus ATCC 10500]|uniref:PQ loop repeat protein n=1 Tax=Talaromyces stipitatus (strain ATCC 10500 / CBS 375.48 / QM 6759 / NRRL 1006) TaxID=441959 RepID=B8M9Q4_TALSN|nr:PQ loop repeat protein [Talaromyces stipitatus ATCC 10500]EED18056.1 PQ loop repeat protein [Talaromyces stipitatus ATCC 10500]